MRVCGCCYEQQGRGDELCVAVQCSAVPCCAVLCCADAGVGAVGGRTLRLGFGLIGIKQHGHLMAMAGGLDGRMTALVMLCPSVVRGRAGAAYC
jgi:hypothetical protein